MRNHSCTSWRYSRYLLVPVAAGLIILNGCSNPAQTPPVVTEAEIRADWGGGFDVLWLREFRFDQNLLDPSRPLGWAGWLQRRSGQTVE